MFSCWLVGQPPVRPLCCGCTRCVRLADVSTSSRWSCCVVRAEKMIRQPDKVDRGDYNDFQALCARAVACRDCLLAQVQK